MKDHGHGDEALPADEQVVDAVLGTGELGAQQPELPDDAVPTARSVTETNICSMTQACKAAAGRGPRGETARARARRSPSTTPPRRSTTTTTAAPPTVAPDHPTSFTENALRAELGLALRGAYRAVTPGPAAGPPRSPATAPAEAGAGPRRRGRPRRRGGTD